MKKYLLLFVASVALLSSCADSKNFEIDGKIIKVEPYGWANKDVKKNDNVIYQPCVGNIVWSVIGIETVALPIMLTGWSLYEPVKVKE